jgi:hypothetical protein
MATLLAETTGYWGAAHIFLMLISLIDNRTSYIRKIVSKLFLMKTGNQQMGIRRLDTAGQRAPSSPSFSFFHSERKLKFCNWKEAKHYD